MSLLLGCITTACKANIALLSQWHSCSLAGVNLPPPPFEEKTWVDFSQGEGVLGISWAGALNRKGDIRLLFQPALIPQYPSFLLNCCSPFPLQCVALLVTLSKGISRNFWGSSWLALVIPTFCLHWFTVDVFGVWSVWHSAWVFKDLIDRQPEASMG